MIHAKSAAPAVDPYAIPDEVCEALCEEYTRLSYTPQAHKAFAQLLRHADDKVHAHSLVGNRIALRDRIVHANFTDHNPYHSFEELRTAALIDGQVDFDSISDHYDHPFWSGYEQARYLVWHDLLGHVETGHDFTPSGELALFAHHAKELIASGDTLAVAALFMEIVYRVVWINVNGWTWHYRPVIPDPVHAPIAHHVMRQVFAGRPVTMPETYRRRPFLVFA